MKIYLAGPLFSTAERDFNAALAALLRRADHEVCLPQENKQRTLDAQALFEQDLAGLDSADIVVANMDGPDPDSGTCWECGYAFRKKPVIQFRTDFRATYEHEKAPYNLMLSQSATLVLDLAFADVPAVAAAIEQALASLKA